MTTIGEKVESFTAGHAIGVDAQAIERDLAALWRQSSSGEKAVTRACLWNLVVRTEGDEAYDRAKQLVDAIAPACPSRVLMLRTQPSGEGPELEAYISANCHIAPGGGKLLCSEEITLEARARGEDHVPALVRALCVPDVPTALFWAGTPPTDGGKVKRLLGGVERMIIDTGDLGGGGALLNLAELLGLARSVDLADLGWLRLGPFRVLIASFFDPPVGAEPLARATRVRLDCSKVGAATAELLLGWLATRLSWGRPERVSSGATRSWRVPRPGGQVALELTVRDVDAGRDGIFELAIESEGGARFSITDAGPSLIELRGTGLPTRVLSAPEHSDAELLVGALGMRGHDPQFGLALTRAAELER